MEMTLGRIVTVVVVVLLALFGAIAYGAYRSYANDAAWCRAAGYHYDWWASSCQAPS